MALMLIMLGGSMTVPYYIPCSLYTTTFGGDKYCSSLTGIFEGIGYLAGFFMDILIGYASDLFGWPPVLIVISLCGFISTFLIFVYQISIRKSALFK